MMCQVTGYHTCILKFRMKCMLKYSLCTGHALRLYYYKLVPYWGCFRDSNMMYGTWMCRVLVSRDPSDVLKATAEYRIGRKRHDMELDKLLLFLWNAASVKERTLFSRRLRAKIVTPRFLLRTYSSQMLQTECDTGAVPRRNTHKTSSAVTFIMVAAMMVRPIISTQ